MCETPEQQRERLLPQARQDLTAAIADTDLVLEAVRASVAMVCGDRGPFRGVCVTGWRHHLTERQRVALVKRATDQLRRSPLPTEKFRRALGAGIRGRL